MKHFTTILPRVREGGGWKIIASLLIKYHGAMLNRELLYIVEGVLFEKGNCWRGGGLS